MLKLLVISGSLNPESHSRALCKYAQEYLEGRGVTVDWLDLRDFPLPLCDGEAAYDDPAVDPLSERIKAADGILIGVPIYNYYVNAAVKNLVELTGSAWEGKLLGFFCAAGGRSSYMSVMDFANQMMLDFRCLIVPRFVYGVHDDFIDGQEIRIQNPKIIERVQQLCDETVKLAAAVKTA